MISEGGEQEEQLEIEEPQVEDAGAANLEQVNIEEAQRVSTKNFGQNRLSVKPGKEAPLKKAVKQKFKYVYAKYREDQEEEADSGYSKELISIKTKRILDRTDLDTLEVWPLQNKPKDFEGIKTLF